MNGLESPPGEPTRAMFLKSILEMLWMRRWIVFIVTASSMAGGAYVTLTATPRYQASARVVLEYIKPNPITGAFVTGKEAEAYVTSQMQAVRDYQVAIPTAEALGLLDSVDLQSTFTTITNSDPDEFPRWVARRIIASTSVRQVDDSNIIEIYHTSTTPELALQVVDTIRAAYIQSAIDASRAGASDNVATLTTLANRSTERLAELEAAKAALEKRDDAVPSVEARRLSDMVTTVRGPYVEQVRDIPSAARLLLADEELAQAGKVLGPNHPGLNAMRRSRDALKAQVDQERALAASIGAGAGLAERARQAAIEVQKNKVLSQRPTMLQLRLMQDEIDGRRQELTALNTKILQLRQLTALQEPGLTALGPAESKPDPVFPNPWLILGGSGFLGLVIGGMLALLIELLNRRVRNARDLESSVGATLLGVIPAERRARGRMPLSVRRQPSARRGGGKTAAA
jgi:uncharacterized protein involved in exopolysaccharide biosynthesis